MRGRGTRASSMSHGLNSYRHLSDVAFMSNLNLNPEIWRFHRECCGLTDEAIRRSSVYHPAYQLVGRGACRDRDYTGPLRAAVPSAGFSEYLSECFPGADVGELSNCEFDRPAPRPRGRPRKENASRSTLRTRRHRERRAAAAHHEGPRAGA
jgi:hypothetical protein